MADMQSQMSDGAPAEEAPEEQAQGAYCIEIRVAADGSLSVGVEPETGEYAEGADKGVPVDGIKAALTKALEIWKANGQMPETAEQDFESGFASRGAM